MKETAHRRIKRALIQSTPHKLEVRETFGCKSETFAIDQLLEEAMRKHGSNLVEKNILHLVHEFNSNDVSGDLRSRIRILEERLHAREDPPEIRMMLRIILQSKKKMLADQQGSPSGTPASSDDEDDDDLSEDELDNRYCFSTSINPTWDSEYDKGVASLDDEEEDHPCYHYQSNIFTFPTATPPTSDSEDDEQVLTSTPSTSDSEDDEEVYPVTFMNKVTDHHPNSRFTIEQIVLSPNKEKIVKVERNMVHVAKTPKTLKKIRKADQVTVPDDKALQNNLKKHKNLKTKMRIW